MGIRRLHSSVELSQDEPELVDLVTGVETVPPSASLGDDLVVTLLPAAKGLCGDSEHLDDRADAVDAVAIVRHPHRIADAWISEKVLRKNIDPNG